MAAGPPLFVNSRSPPPLKASRNSASTGTACAGVSERPSRGSALPWKVQGTRAERAPEQLDVPCRATASARPGNLNGSLSAPVNLAGVPAIAAEQGIRVGGRGAGGRAESLGQAHVLRDGLGTGGGGRWLAADSAPHPAASATVTGALATSSRSGRCLIMADPASYSHAWRAHSAAARAIRPALPGPSSWRGAHVMRSGRRASGWVHDRSCARQVGMPDRQVLEVEVIRSRSRSPPRRSGG